MTAPGPLAILRTAGLACLVLLLAGPGPRPAAGQEDPAEDGTADEDRSEDVETLRGALGDLIDVVGRGAPPRFADQLDRVRSILDDRPAADPDVEVRRVRTALVALIEHLRSIGPPDAEADRLSSILRELGASPTPDLGERARRERQAEECTLRLRLIGEALLGWREEHDSLPVVEGDDAGPGGAHVPLARLLEEGHLQNPTALCCPATPARPLGPDADDPAGSLGPANVSYRGLVRSPGPDAPPETPLLWDPAPLHDGGRHVLRLDGEVDRLDEAAFRERMARFDLPEEG